MVRGQKVYEPPQYMSVNTAVQQILENLKERGDEDGDVLSEESLAVGVARLGSDKQTIISGKCLKLK